MFRGFLSGVAFGVIIGGVVLTLISLMGPQPVGQEPPQSPQVQAPEGAGTGATDAGSDAPVADDLAAAPALGVAPQVASPEGEGTAPAPDTTPGDVPAASGVEGALDTPTASATQQPDLTAEAPVTASGQGGTLAPPLTEANPNVANAPAAAPAPQITEQSTAPAPIVTDASGGSNIALDTPPLPSPAPMEVTGPTPDAQPTTDSATPLAPPQSPDVTAAAPEAPAENGAEPEVVVIAPERPQVGLSGAPALAMPTGDSSVTVRRPGADAAPAETTAEAPRAALLRYASDFEPTAKPLMGVILLDEGTMAGGPDALAASGVPVTVAIDPSLPGGTALMAAYRDRGIEVLATVSLPANAQPSDVEVSMAAVFMALPETIGILDATGAGLPETTAAQAQVMAALKADGRGFVTLPRGLNSSTRAAEAASVPAVSIYRDFDAQGQDARVIRRFLDQAAFRARQESGVVMLGRVRPETISALILWSTANRASDVAQAPVSAILQSR